MSPPLSFGGHAELVPLQTSSAPQLLVDTRHTVPAGASVRRTAVAGAVERTAHHRGGLELAGRRAAVVRGGVVVVARLAGVEYAVAADGVRCRRRSDHEEKRDECRALAHESQAI
jgi:hypothetical protein